METPTIIALLALIAAVTQSLFALLTYMGWSKSFLSDKFTRTAQQSAFVPIFAVGGLMISLLALGLILVQVFTASCPPCETEAPASSQSGLGPYVIEKRLEEVRGRRFHNEKVELDGELFTDCEFTDVTFIFNGTRAFSFDDVKVNGFRFGTESKSVGDVLYAMRVLGMFKPDIQLLGADDRPLPNPAPSLQASPTPKPTVHK